MKFVISTRIYMRPKEDNVEKEWSVTSNDFYRSGSLVLIFLAHSPIMRMADDHNCDIEKSIVPSILQQLADESSTPREGVVLKLSEIKPLDEKLGFLFTSCYKIKLAVEIDSKERMVGAFVKVIVSH